MRVRVPSPIPFTARRCRTAVSSLVFHSSYAGANPATDSTLSPFTLRSASGEAMTDSTNHASVRSLGANERWVQLPPLRLILSAELRAWHFATVPRMGHNRAKVVG